MNLFYNLNKTRPATIIIFSFISAIIIGALLLKIPLAAVTGSISFTNALFTAASAVCVTGLTVVDTGSFFTIFGQIVILILIQLGGLGIMTVSVFLFNRVKKTIGINQRQVLQDLYTHTPRKDILYLLYTIFFFTGISELAGTVSLFVNFKNLGTIPNPFFSAIFHSVSAFCNAGFSLFSDSFISMGNLPGINITLLCLIIFGGLGFPVVYEIFHILFRTLRGIRSKFSLQSKTVLSATAVLILGGSILFLLIESDNILQSRTPGQKIMTAVFQSVTCRTAGFNTVEISALKEPSLFLMIILMFIGASPGSCGGGIKTTTICVLFFYFYNRLKCRTQTSFFNRGIADEVVLKSFILIIIYFLIINIFTFLILLTEGTNFITVLFEVVSAVGTVGLSAGITNLMGSTSKYLIIILMIAGRVGLLTMAYLLIGTKPQIQKKFAEENIMIG